MVKFYDIFGREYANLPLDINHSDVKRIFTMGHCHSLALALRKLTGGELWGIWKEESDIPDHIVIKLEEKFLDIEGFKTLRRLEREYYKIEKVNWNKIKAGYYPPKIKASLPFARLLLKKYDTYRQRNLY